MGVIFIIGTFCIPNCFVSRHITTGILCIAISLIPCITICPIETIKVTRLSLYVLLFATLWGVHQVCHSVLGWLDWIENISFLLLFFILSQQEFNRRKLVKLYFLGSIATVVMEIWGLLQLLGVVPAYNMFFPITGSFENPTGLAIFSSTLLPCSLYFTLEKNVKYKIWGCISSFFGILVILLTHSRTGILITFILCMIYLFQNKSSLLNYILKCKYLFIGVIFLLLVGIYFWKKDSADGRILIWLCSLDMFNEHYFLGIGSGRFQAEYMLYQAEFFDQYPNSTFTMLADNTRHPFNEYLKILVEYGMLGFSLVGLIFFNIVKVYTLHKNNRSLFPVFGCILSIMLAACTSYPLNYPSIIFIGVLSAAIINSYQVIIWEINKKIKIKQMINVITLFLFFYLCFVCWYGLLEYKWNKMTQYFFHGKVEKVLSQYEKIYTWMKRDGLFLYNYGVILNQERKYHESIKMLHECCLYFNDFDVQMLLAQNYIHIGAYKNAEQHLILASKMCPVRFLPLYKLMNLYSKMQKNDKANYYAQIIINKPVKVNSLQVIKIKKAAKILLENNSRYEKCISYPL